MELVLTLFLREVLTFLPLLVFSFNYYGKREARLSDDLIPSVLLNLETKFPSSTFGLLFLTLCIDLGFYILSSGVFGFKVEFAL